MDWNIEYGALVTEDTDFVSRCEALKECLIELQECFDEILPQKKYYDQMSLSLKIEFDLFIAYSICGLQWVNLRILGIDPNTQPVKDELNRVKMAMMKWQEIKDKSKRPEVDIKAARRFIRSGLYDGNAGEQPMNKKIKFSDDD